MVRGAGGHPAWSPARGYRYDGLYVVEDSFREQGKSGFLVCRFRLRKLAEEVAVSTTGLGAAGAPPPAGTATPSTRGTRQQRVVRSTPVVDWVKARHDFTCQVCGVRLAGPNGPYAEGAHIRGLGRPHSGPDAVENVLCLCPNHHVLFDLGAFTLTDELALEGAPGQLRTHPDHRVSLEHVRYHRSHCARTGRQ